MLNLFRAFSQKLLGAIVFYTQIPLSHQWPLDFDGIARFAPLVGLLIGLLLNVAIALSDTVALSSSLVSVLIVTLWITITGAIHLDGAMDMADGLGVLDRSRRLDIMRDSHTGAYGTITAIVLVLIKTTALTALLNSQFSILTSLFCLPLICGWSRWAQLIAIARFPYLHDSGKGKLHQTAVTSFWDAFPSGLILVAIGIAGYYLDQLTLEQMMLLPIVTVFFGWGLSTWIARQFGGHTGDTYGAVVEWTEAVLLCVMSGF
jgi:adenosylcobinamide-GDP ribazoletransferase